MIICQTLWPLWSAVGYPIIVCSAASASPSPQLVLFLFPFPVNLRENNGKTISPGGCICPTRGSVSHASNAGTRGLLSGVSRCTGDISHSVACTAAFPGLQSSFHPPLQNSLQWHLMHSSLYVMLVLVFQFSMEWFGFHFMFLMELCCVWYCCMKLKKILQKTECRNLSLQKTKPWRQWWL